MLGLSSFLSVGQCAGHVKDKDQNGASAGTKERKREREGGRERERGKGGGLQPTAEEETRSMCGVSRRG